MLQKIDLGPGKLYGSSKGHFDNIGNVVGHSMIILIKWVSVTRV